MMAAYCSDAVIGNYRVATNFAVLLTFFTFPITTVLFPVFSKLNPLKDKQVLKSVFTTAAKYTAFLLVPATLGNILWCWRSRLLAHCMLTNGLVLLGFWF